jgi:hypothetical protein
MIDYRPTIQGALNLQANWKGLGEIDLNNSGWFVHFLTQGKTESWCAALQYTALEISCWVNGLMCPIPRIHTAKGFANAIAKVGKEVSVEELQQGDWVVKKRLGWMGHIWQVQSVQSPGIVLAYDGNSGSFTKTKGLVRESQVNVLFLREQNKLFKCVSLVK